MYFIKGLVTKAYPVELKLNPNGPIQISRIRHAHEVIIASISYSRIPRNKMEHSVFKPRVY
jgi:hypothetical protein